MDALDERTRTLIEGMHQKHWGKYRGIVKDRNDPEQLGRLKVQVPSLLADAITGWAWPVAPYAGANLGTFFVPQVDDLVWVEFAEGELEHPLWTGGGWAKPNNKTEIPQEAQGSYPDQQVIKTKSGHIIIFDDTSGSETLTIRAKSGTEIVIDPNADQITVTAQSVTVQADSVTVKNSAGNPQPLATKTFVQQLFDRHSHSSGVGPTGTPLVTSDMVPFTLTSVLEAE